MLHQSTPCLMLGSPKLGMVVFTLRMVFLLMYLKCCHICSTFHTLSPPLLMESGAVSRVMAHGVGWLGNLKEMKLILVRGLHISFISSFYSTVMIQYN